MNYFAPRLPASESLRLLLTRCLSCLSLSIAFGIYAPTANWIKRTHFLIIISLHWATSSFVGQISPHTLGVNIEYHLERATTTARWCWVSTIVASPLTLSRGRRRVGLCRKVTTPKSWIIHALTHLGGFGTQTALALRRTGFHGALWQASVSASASARFLHSPPSPDRLIFTIMNIKCPPLA